MTSSDPRPDARASDGPDAPDPGTPASAPTPPLQLRQGDVLLVAVPGVPATATARPRDGRLVLALGEATGHAHAINERSAREYTHDGQRYLLTKSIARLLHEEHAPIEVPPGAYRIVIQREYEPAPVERQAWRRVID